MNKIFSKTQLNRVLLVQNDPKFSAKRTFWEFINKMFNAPDPDRVKRLGPNRTCAEWVLRNGGSIVWKNGKRLSDYNLLPKETEPVPNIIEIDGTNSSISHYGFPHLDGCKDIESIILHNASYIDDRALSKLSPVEESVHNFQLSSNGNVTDEGLKELHNLRNLKTLVIFNLSAVKEQAQCLDFIKAKLPTVLIKTE